MIQLLLHNISFFPTTPQHINNKLDPRSNIFSKMSTKISNKLNIKFRALNVEEVNL